MARLTSLDIRLPRSVALPTQLAFHLPIAKSVLFVL